ncbi:MAG: protein kinase [Kiritimatiellae bacterium]|nr:protein kinase [Kiritimatiellia bacterium]MDD5522755.1 protein kinase [Kiritimatiellia bacterium]
MIFECSDCGQSLEMQTLYAGQVVTCPVCSAHIMVPHTLPEGTSSDSGDVEINLQSVKESFQAGTSNGSGAISTLKANQQLQDTVEPGTASVETDNTSISNVLTAQPETKYLIGDIIASTATVAAINAKDVNLRRNVAMKVMLDPEDATNARILRFIKEAQITGQLEHPGIVPLHELGIYGGNNIFYTMKNIKGKTLSDVLQKLRDGDKQTIAKYPLSHLLTIFQKVCDAIAFAHSKRVIHLDLEPENIMFGDYGEVIVKHWGLAKVLPKKQSKESPDEELLKAMDEAIAGSPEFMAPEQAMGKSNKLDRRTDIYSLGAILYNILTLNPPPAETNPDGSVKMNAQDYSKIHNPGKVALKHLPDAHIPSSLAAICTKALQADHEKRYQTVKELQKDVEAYQNGYATRAEHAGIRRQIQLFVRRHKTITTLAVLIVLFASMAGIASTTLWMWAKKATSNAIAEKQLAAKAITTLKDCAPDMLELSMMFMEKMQIDEALKRISYAVELMPENAQYRYLKGNALETMLRIEDAEQAYDEALKLDPNHKMAAENKQFCRKILESTMGLKSFASTTIGELYTAIRSQERFYEAIAIAQWMITNSGGTIVENIIRETLDTTGVKYAFTGIDTQGICRVGLSETSISDLSPLRGLPITHLSLLRTHIKDLSALKGMPLTWLDISQTGITDLSPLNGMHLTYLRVDYNGVTDLSPLAESQLKKLFLYGNTIEDLAILKGMPVDELDLRNTGFQDFQSLKQFPLTRLYINGINDLAVLKGLQLTYLNLLGSKCTDLSPLTNMPLVSLVLDLTPVRDLSPLKGMMLKELSISNAPVSDLSPLNNLPLKTLTLDRPKIRLLPQIEAIKSLVNVYGFDHYSLLAPCRQSVKKKNFTHAKKLATDIIDEWSDVPAVSNLCRTAKWMLDVYIPLFEKPGEFPPGTISAGGHHYCMVQIPMKWEDAKAFCETTGGHLITPVNKKKWIWLLNTFPERDDLWLGGFKDPVSGQWKWVTGENLEYSDWAPGQPDNYLGKDNVLKIFRGGFYDANKEQPLRFIIEWDK